MVGLSIHGRAFLGMMAAFADFQTNIRKNSIRRSVAAKDVSTARKPKALAKKNQR